MGVGVIRLGRISFAAALAFMSAAAVAPARAQMADPPAAEAPASSTKTPASPAQTSPPASPPTSPQALPQAPSVPADSLVQPLAPSNGQTAVTPLRLTLDGKIEGPSAAFLVALEQGYFKNEGLEVSIAPAAAPLEPFTRVASGMFDIGVGDINALVRYRDQNPGAPLKAVFVIHNLPSYAVVGRKSRGIDAPADLAGRKLGAPVAEQASAQWPVFARLTGVDPSKVTVLNVGLPVREPMLAAGEVDAVTGSSFSTPLALRAKGVPTDDISVLLMSAYGLDAYGSTIFVNTRVLAEKPEAVRGFLRAYLQGLKDTIRDPGEAVATVVRRTSGTSRDIELARLMIALRDCVLTPETQARGLGDIDPARFDGALAMMEQARPFKTPPKLSDVFDPSFLPPEADRRLD